MEMLQSRDLFFFFFLQVEEWGGVFERTEMDLGTILSGLESWHYDVGKYTFCQFP